MNGVTNLLKKNALTPPIPLYRRLLRAHRTMLGPQERALGDEYVKAEFRRHRGVTNPLHLVGFLTSWQRYAETLEVDAWKKTQVDNRDLLESLNEQQLGQLYELLRALREQTDSESDPLKK
ncbi:mitochondrial respiratory chain complex II assembly LYR family protein Sdh7 [Schizosaccharomyces osmophilus]|uniref:Succinate dehydrogenase assembly factor 3 n=1 Tax=Schizosaccharomyces osmophilus TaxID=2545709 RepID=A0AAE9WDL9_9SCHI|nr:mitochondrial respiratory chain complex II assembly LYR family protein Sdh7 [Schizosaccharomyces osmophilus]WBW72773.1 mitochondrial respiratory chain complex II assembly LYR family protein Sdh7 [Schizosaccharomyces osmophilus]